MRFISKLLDILISLAFNGFMALIFSMIAYIAIGLLLMLAMIPVSILVGDAAVNAVWEPAGSHAAFTLIYFIVFLSLLAEDFAGFDGLKRKFGTRGK